MLDGEPPSRPVVEQRRAHHRRGRAQSHRAKSRHRGGNEEHLRPENRKRQSHHVPDGCMWKSPQPENRLDDRRREDIIDQLEQLAIAHAKSLGY